MRVWRSIDDRGNSVEHRETAEWRQVSTLDADGRRVKVVTRLPDSRIGQEDHFAYADDPVPPKGAPAVQLHSAKGTNISERQFQRFLEQLPPLPQWTPDLRDVGIGYGERADEPRVGSPRHPWGRYTRDVRDGWVRSVADLLGKRIQITAAQTASDRVEITDDWGGTRFDQLRNTASLGAEDGGRVPAVTSQDQFGRIAQIVTNDLGFPAEGWFGENLVVRYHYPQLLANELLSSGGVEGLWMEFIDVRTGEVLLDSRRLGVTGRSPVFEAAGGVVESLGDELFVAVWFGHTLQTSTDRYALLPLNGGEPWRSLVTGGTEEPMLWTRVDYTDSRLRLHIRSSEGDLIVEAPRRGRGSVRVVHPAGLDLPLSPSESAANVGDTAGIPSNNGGQPRRRPAGPQA